MGRAAVKHAAGARLEEVEHLDRAWLGLGVGVGVGSGSALGLGLGSALGLGLLLGLGSGSGLGLGLGSSILSAPFCTSLARKDTFTASAACAGCCSPTCEG